MDRYVISDDIYNESVSLFPLSSVIHPSIQSELDDMENECSPTPLYYKLTAWWTTSKALPFEGIKAYMHSYPQILLTERNAALQGIIGSLLNVVR